MNNQNKEDKYIDTTFELEESLVGENISAKVNKKMEEDVIKEDDKIQENIETEELEYEEEFYSDDFNEIDNEVEEIAQEEIAGDFEKEEPQPENENIEADDEALKAKKKKDIIFLVAMFTFIIAAGYGTYVYIFGGSSKKTTEKMNDDMDLSSSAFRDTQNHQDIKKALAPVTKREITQQVSSIKDDYKRAKQERQKENATKRNLQHQKAKQEAPQQEAPQQEAPQQEAPQQEITSYKTTEANSLAREDLSHQAPPSKAKKLISCSPLHRDSFLNKYALVDDETGAKELYIAIDTLNGSSFVADEEDTENAYNGISNEKYMRINNSNFFVNIKQVKENYSCSPLK